MKKILLNLNEINPGMTTAEPVLSNNNQVILQEGTKLTSHIINLLQKRRIKSLYVQRPAPAVNKTHEQLAPYIPNNNLINCKYFSEKYSKAAVKSGGLFEYMRYNEQVPFNALRQLSEHDLYGLVQEPNPLCCLYKLKPPVDYTYLHSIDVGIIAGMIGLWCGFSEKIIKTLILAGLMHDIGKSQIPYSLLNKAANPNSNEMEILRLHTTYGYYMTKDNPDITEDIQFAILQHHERENGSGYPDNLPSHKIHPFAKILAIADVYDALTSNRVYKKSITPFAALEILADEMFIHFDCDYCRLFIRHATQALIKSTVLLSDETQGEVQYFSTFMSIKPVLRKENGSIVDLNYTTNTRVVEIVKFNE